MAGRLAIFHPPGRFGLIRNPFGKDVANLQLWQALARHAGFDRLDVLSLQSATVEEARQGLFGAKSYPTEIAVDSVLRQSVAAEAGALFRGTPELAELAWLRRRSVGDRGYSLIGLVHTIAPPEIRSYIAATAVAPMHPWDGLICTSPAVREGLSAMFHAWGEHLAERTGGRPPPHPLLPVIPLGVDGAAMAAVADRPEARARIRAELGIADDEVLILWVGRLSYFEKAFPQPMFKAVQQAAAQTGAKLHFVLAGWFPSEGDSSLYQDAARVHAPDVAVRFEDGNDRPRLGELWAAADVFLSLVDNIQETFGITPLEAMAAGVPVVASDWDGYRFTVRDGVEGFLIPTLGGPAGGRLGANLVLRHVLGVDTYQGYVGAVAQHTAVHIGRCARAIAELVRSPELRRRMGAAGRARVREAFDWPVVARQIRGLVEELGVVRAHAADPPMRHRLNPVKGDPFADFAHFATAPLDLDTPIAPVAGVSAEDVRRAGEAVALDKAFGALRAPPDRCARAFELLAAGEARTVRELLLAFPVEERRALELAVAWMAKHGFVDWLT